MNGTVPDLPDIPAAASTNTVLITPTKQRTNDPNMFPSVTLILNFL